MKPIILIFICLFTEPSAFSQSTFQNNLKGKWISVNERDTLTLNFIDNTRCEGNLGITHGKIGAYSYKIRTVNNNTLLSLKPNAQTAMNYDSLIFTMARLDNEEFKIKTVVRYYNDRPPESLLEENKIYLLKKEK